MSVERADLSHTGDQSSFAGPARVVANVGDDMVFGVEAGAPLDGGAMVLMVLASLPPLPETANSQHDRTHLIDMDQPSPTRSH
jgi:hypothetical protein